MNRATILRRFITFEKIKSIALRACTYTAIVICFFCCSLAAQTRQYLFSHLGVRDGLLQETIVKVQEDKKGYIWIATHNAIQRYDGHRFLDFIHKDNDPNSIPAEGIRHMLIDKKNRLWILSGTSLLGYLDVDKFTYTPVAIRYPPGEFNKETPALHIDNDGNIMLIFVGAGFLTYNENKNEVAKQYNPFELPEGWEPLYLWQDAARNYWIGAHRGLLKYNASKKILSYRGHNNENDPVIEEFKDARTVILAYVDKAKHFWILSWPQNSMFIKSYSPATRKVTEWQQAIGKALQYRYYHLHAINELQDSSIWLSGHNLFASVNKLAKGIDVIPGNSSEEYSIRYDNITQLFEDRERNVWVGTDKGLYRFNPPAQMFKTVKNVLAGKDSVYTPDVTDILQTPDGEILVSTWGNGIFSYDKNFKPVQSKYIDRIHPTSEGLVWCLTRRKNGDIWRGSQDGYIYIYEARTHKTLKLRPQVFENSTIRQIEEDKKGNLWIGSQRGFLVRWNPHDKSFTLVKKLKSIISRIYVDEENYIWVCTDTRGVYRINSSNDSTVAAYTSQGPAGKKLLINGAADVIQYNDSIIVIAGDGLNILNKNTNTFKYFTTANGLPSSNISNIIKDRDGYIWMSNALGIASYHPYQKKLSIYNASDGVHTSSFSVAASALLNDGSIALGTNHDFIVFTPALVTVAEYVPPRVEISSFSLMNKALVVDSLFKLPRVTLDNFEHSLTIELSTLTYQNLYPMFYMMEGMDKDWVQVGKLNQATFNYMPPGTYVFKTACRDSHGNIGHVTSLNIYIKPPFWRTWWFLSLLAFAFLSLLYWFDKFRVAKIMETERVRTRIATSLTRDMSSTLSNINLLSEMAKLKVEKDIERTKDYITKISDNSNRMMEVMDDIIWSINPENDELQYTLTRMQRYASEIQSKYNVEISFNVEKKASHLKLHMDKRHEMFLIYKEALLNTGMHANSKLAEVSISNEATKLIMKITDDGKGFHPDRVSFGRGLNDMQKRATLLNAELKVTSERNTGTTVELVMNV